MSKKDKAEKVKKLSEGDATKAILEFLRRVRAELIISISVLVIGQPTI